MMWQLSNPITTTARLNFDSSRGYKADIQQLWNNEIKIINALNYLEWDYQGDFSCQFIVCEVCGFAGCQSQNWVSLRKSQSLALISLFARQNVICKDYVFALVMRSPW